MNFIKNLNSHNLELTIWKSFERYGEFLEGKTDIDIFSNKNFDEISNKFEKVGIKKFNSEKYRKFEDVYDYFYLTSIDEKPLILHLHFFEQIRTGTSFTKNLLIPKDFYRIDENKNEFNYVNKNDSSVIDFIRHVYKFRILNYYYYLKYRDKNYLHLDKGLKQNLLDAWNQNLSQKIKSLKFTNDEKLFYLLNKKNSFTTDFKIRRRTKKLSKSLNVHNFLIEKFLFYKKFLQKKFFGSGKEVRKSNIIVAFVAPDGSGKSTISIEVFNFFNKQFKTKIYYLGINKKIKNLRKNISTSLSKSSKSKMRWIKHIYNSISSLSVSIVKFYFFIKVKYFVKNSIIIFDRYPLEKVDSLPSYKKSIFKNFESKLNKFKPKLDLLLYVNVSPEVIKDRNNFNVITIYNKEKLYREEVNKQHPKDVVFINNNGQINTSINESAKAIWNLI